MIATPFAKARNDSNFIVILTYVSLRGGTTKQSLFASLRKVLPGSILVRLPRLLQRPAMTGMKDCRAALAMTVTLANNHLIVSLRGGTTEAIAICIIREIFTWFCIIAIAAPFAKARNDN